MTTSGLIAWLTGISMPNGGGPAPDPNHDWPDLPPGCPPAVAAAEEGTFFRLINGGPMDWRSQADHHGAEWCATGTRARVSLCRWHSLSIFADAVAANQLRQRFPAKFGDHQVVAFDLTPAMGAIENDHNAHYNWWPHGTAFVPPPEFEAVTP